jgi:ElaB/YqjD/DUF883 family membrane-anchored ribosome-binding protein
MNPKTNAQIAEGNFTRNMTNQKQLTTAAKEWAGGVRESVQQNLKKAGYQTETYVRNNPGRFIAGACCVGLAAGFLLGRTAKSKHQ